MNPLVSRLRFASILLATLSLASASSLVTPQTIDDEIGIGYGLEIADINGDGKDDILLVDKDNVAWYENPTWEKHVISGPLTEKDHVSIAARDTDGDGKLSDAEWGKASKAMSDRMGQGGRGGRGGERGEGGGGEGRRNRGE